MDNLTGQVYNVANAQQMPTQQTPYTQQSGYAPTQQVQNTQAVFSQEQLNSIVSNRVNPLTQQIKDLQAQLAQAQSLSNGYLNELTGFKQRNTAISLGVPSSMVDFVVFESNKLAVNGKSFEDAVKEYTATNSQLFGVSQMGGQGNAQVTTPTVTQPTQVTASPAQTAQLNQQNIPYQQVVNPQVQVAQPSQVNQMAQVNQAGVSQVNNNNNMAGQQSVNTNQGVLGATQAIPQNTVVQNQYGSTGFNATAPSQVNAVDSQVTEFLKSRGLSK